MTVAVRVLTDGAQMAAVEPAWRMLWERTPGATPFSHPDWLIPWWRHLGRGALRLFVAERDDHLPGVLPLCAVTSEQRLMLQPLGFDVSDYAEPLIGPDRPRAAFAALLEALAAAPGWEACAFVLRDRTPLGDQLGASGLRARVAELEAAPVLDLAAGYSDCLPPGIRKSLAEASRRLRKLGEATFESATPETTGTMLDSLFALHQRRWGERGATGVLDHPAVQSFHREAATRLASAGMLRLYRMRIGGRDAAILYALAAKGTVHYYIGGFEPDYAAASPGSLVIAHAIERAVGEGARAFDFLKGREAYKYRWGATDRSRWSYEITRAEEPADDIAAEPDAGPVRA